MAIPNAIVQQGDEALGSNALASPKLTQHGMINILADEMGERVKKGFLYGSLQGKVLVFYFNHNVMAMEFMKDLDKFKEKIKPLYLEHKMSKIIYFTKIEARVENRSYKRPEQENKNPEKAKGDFVNGAVNADIFAKFEKLRKHIKENRS